MQAPLDASVRACHVTSGMQTHFSKLDLQSPVQRSNPAPGKVDSAAALPAADELSERLSELACKSRTPPTIREPRPIPNAVASNGVGSFPDGSRPGHDSGYSSITSSPAVPDAVEAARAAQSRFNDTRFKSSKLCTFDKVIPDFLKNRFHDLKVLHSARLLQAAYKKNANQRDISMKLKYLGTSEADACLYIVVQCEEKCAKNVKNFFAQKNVVEDIRQDFKIHIVKKGLQALASSDVLQVYGTRGVTRHTLCGRPIKVYNQKASAFATIGGLVQVTTKASRTPILCGLTAAHSVVDLYRRISVESLSSVDGDSSESSDDEEVLFDELYEDELDEQELNAEIDPFDGQEVAAIGTMLAQSTPNKANRDWALIALDDTEILPNYLYKASQSTADSFVETLFCTRARLPLESSMDVMVITSHGLQKGRLEADVSFLCVAPGKEFVQTFDLKPVAHARLRPGDSGSWVVHGTTGEVFGYVVSIDAFGEAYVIPIQDTLSDIEICLGADNVTLPTVDQIQALLKDSTIATTISAVVPCSVVLSELIADISDHEPRPESNMGEAGAAEPDQGHVAAWVTDSASDEVLAGQTLPSLILPTPSISNHEPSVHAQTPATTPVEVGAPDQKPPQPSHKATSRKMTSRFLTDMFRRQKKASQNLQSQKDDSATQIRQDFLPQQVMPKKEDPMSCAPTPMTVAVPSTHLLDQDRSYSSQIPHQYDSPAMYPPGQYGTPSELEPLAHPHAGSVATPYGPTGYISPWYYAVPSSHVLQKSGADSGYSSLQPSAENSPQPVLVQGMPHTDEYEESTLFPS